MRKVWRRRIKNSYSSSSVIHATCSGLPLHFNNDCRGHHDDNARNCTNTQEHEHDRVTPIEDMTQHDPNPPGASHDLLRCSITKATYTSSTDGVLVLRSRPPA